MSASSRITSGSDSILTMPLDSFGTWLESRLNTHKVHTATSSTHIDAFMLGMLINTFATEATVKEAGIKNAYISHNTDGILLMYVTAVDQVKDQADVHSVDRAQAHSPDQAHVCLFHTSDHKSTSNSWYSLSEDKMVFDTLVVQGMMANLDADGYPSNRMVNDALKRVRTVQVSRPPEGDYWYYGENHVEKHFDHLTGKSKPYKVDAKVRAAQEGTTVLEQDLGLSSRPKLLNKIALNTAGEEQMNGNIRIPQVMTVQSFLSRNSDSEPNEYFRRNIDALQKSHADLQIELTKQNVLYYLKGGLLNFETKFKLEVTSRYQPSGSIEDLTFMSKIVLGRFGDTGVAITCMILKELSEWSEDARKRIKNLPQFLFPTKMQSELLNHVINVVDLHESTGMISVQQDEIHATMIRPRFSLFEILQSRSVIKQTSYLNRAIEQVLPLMNDERAVHLHFLGELLASGTERRLENKRKRGQRTEQATTEVARKFVLTYDDPSLHGVKSYVMASNRRAIMLNVGPKVPRDKSQMLMRSLSSRLYSEGIDEVRSINVELAPNSPINGVGDLPAVSPRVPLRDTWNVHSRQFLYADPEHTFKGNVYGLAARCDAMMNSRESLRETEIEIRPPGARESLSNFEDNYAYAVRYFYENAELVNLRPLVQRHMTTLLKSALGRLGQVIVPDWRDPNILGVVSWIPNELFENSYHGEYMLHRLEWHDGGTNGAWASSSGGSRRGYTDASITHTISEVGERFLHSHGPDFRENEMLMDDVILRMTSMFDDEHGDIKFRGCYVGPD